MRTLLPARFRHGARATDSQVRRSRRACGIEQAATLLVNDGARRQTLERPDQTPPIWGMDCYGVEVNFTDRF